MGAQPGKPTNDPVNYFAVGKQTAKGTAAATYYFLKHLDGSSFEVQKEIQRNKEGGDGQETGLSWVSRVTADGQLMANCRPEIVARAALGGLGAEGAVVVGASGAVQSATTAAASLARHTFVLAASLPYWSMEQRFSDEVERSLDNVVTGFTIEGEAGAPWKITSNFVSGGTVFQRDAASALTVTRDVGKPFFYANGSYIFDGGASYSADVTKIKVEVQRQVDSDIQTTGLGRDDVIPLAADVQVDFTLKYTSRDFYQKVTYNGGSVAVSDLPTGSIDLAQLQQVYLNGSISATGLMRAFTGLLEYSDAKVNKLDPDGKTVYVDVVANSVKHPGGSSPLTVLIDTFTTALY